MPLGLLRPGLSRTHSATLPLLRLGKRRSWPLTTHKAGLAGPARYQKAIKRELKTKKRWKERMKKKKEDALLEEFKASSVDFLYSSPGPAPSSTDESPPARRAKPSRQPPRQSPPDGDRLSTMLGDLDPFQAPPSRMS